MQPKLETEKDWSHQHSLGFLETSSTSFSISLHTALSLTANFPKMKYESDKRSQVSICFLSSSLYMQEYFQEKWILNAGPALPGIQ
jgi:hypothetical protein